MSEYQPRTHDRLIEILKAQDENPRSWQQEAAAKLVDLKWLAENKNTALNEAMAEVDRLRAIVRVNGLRWGHTHAEIDALLANSSGIREGKS